MVRRSSFTDAPSLTSYSWETQLPGEYAAAPNRGKVATTIREDLSCPAPCSQGP